MAAEREAARPGQPAAKLVERQAEAAPFAAWIARPTGSQCGRVTALPRTATSE